MGAVTFWVGKHLGGVLRHYVLLRFSLCSPRGVHPPLIRTQRLSHPNKRIANYA